MSFIRKNIGTIIVYLFTLICLLLGMCTEFRFFVFVGTIAASISCWISYLHGYADAINRENALKVVHTIKDDTDKVVIAEFIGKDDELNSQDTYEYAKQWQDKFRHVITHKRT